MPEGTVMVDSDADARRLLEAAGPHAHPNDGVLDTYDAHLPVGQLLTVRARLHHGAHLPHPGIKERRTASMDVDLGQELPLRVDGDLIGRARTLSVRVQPDALTV